MLLKLFELPEVFKALKYWGISYLLTQAATAACWQHGRINSCLTPKTIRPQIFHGTCSHHYARKRLTVRVVHATSRGSRRHYRRRQAFARDSPWGLVRRTRN